MRSQCVFGGLVCLTALSCASPIGSPSDNSPKEKRNLLVPGSLMPTTTVDPATWVTAVWTGTPIFLATSLVVLATDTAIARRNPDVFDVLTSMPNLVPTSVVDLATDSTGPAFTGTRDFMPTTVVKLGTTTGCVVSVSAYTHSSELAYSYVTHCSDGAAPTTEALVAKNEIAE